ncbi:MAG: MBL fold metallo-hydrolase [Chloroflexi bacterium]|jgi:glyoxylase-like metal-dependent hydrolase (beta-lactamase superfamily II)|nr:MBL fold metallo-hydrolase [Chloroflexota bacterium]MBT5627105.1 MBL fold metallo-hydrolase [Chloroflexota bacterium]
MSTIFTGKYWSIQNFVSGFSNNAYLITCNRTNNSVVIDTPANPLELIEARAKTNPTFILITHGHQDHLEGFEAVNIDDDPNVGIGEDDRSSLPTAAKFGIDVSTNQQLNAGDISLKAMATPGHTPGSTCYLLETPESLAAGERSHVFTGDTLFPGGPGKSSSNDALKQIISSLETHIFTLSDSTVVLPGHGEFTTINKSKAEFAVFKSKPFDTTMSGDVTWA